MPPRYLSVRASVRRARRWTRRGYKVLVLEQHDRAGGGLHSFTEKAPSSLTRGFITAVSLEVSPAVHCDYHRWQRISEILEERLGQDSTTK